MRYLMSASVVFGIIIECVCVLRIIEALAVSRIYIDLKLVRGCCKTRVV